MTEDFAHRLPIDRIRDGERIDLVAGEGELRAVADRIGLARLNAFTAHATLERAERGIRATGRLQAALEQRCVVTGEPVPAHVDEAFDLLFVAVPADGKREEEVELSADECDIVFHDGAAIDLGAAMADSLALALDPYPRSAGAEAALKEAGIMSEAEAGPFAALAGLRKTLGGSDA